MSYEEHKGEEVKLTMNVVSYPKTALQRQATEAHHITLNENNNLLNRRGEWGQNLPPKLVVEGTDDSNEK